MGEDLVAHETTVDSKMLYLKAFSGGKDHGRCVQLTIGSSGFVQMTFKEAIDTFKTMIGSIEKLNDQYDRKPPWWEEFLKTEEVKQS